MNEQARDAVLKEIANRIFSECVTDFKDTWLMTPIGMVMREAWHAGYETGKKEWVSGHIF